MNCPACDTALTQMQAGGITVDACQGGCGGLWFDRFELSKVDEPRESAGESLLHLDRRAGLRLDHARRRICPRCAGVVMLRHFFSAKQQVTVDACPTCAGIWLDAGELATIRQEYPTDAERKKAAEAYFDEIFGKQLADLHAQGEAHAARARQIAHLFRFICPSYYLPGKQEWGAF